MVFLVFLGLAGDRKSVNVVNDNYIAPMEIKMKSVIKKFAKIGKMYKEECFL